jgi:hypothetical protein
VSRPASAVRRVSGEVLKDWSDMGASTSVRFREWNECAGAGGRNVRELRNPWTDGVIDAWGGGEGRRA